MIVDSLERADSYYSKHPVFKEAFDFLRQPKLANIPVGRYEIKGNQLFCMISKKNGRSHAEVKLEAHQKYVDIQYVISGLEQVGWRQTSTCNLVHTKYDIEKDICYFDDEPKMWTQIQPGSFVIFYPEDAHAPLVSNKEIHKAVIKVMLNP
ncbi:MAG: YhcH/YjgK/YiaL family protein [Phycisphaerales bacterium]